MRRVEGWSFPFDYQAPSITDAPLPDDEMAPRPNTRGWLEMDEMSEESFRGGVITDALEDTDEDPLELLSPNLRLRPRGKGTKEESEAWGRHLRDGTPVLS